MCIELKVEDWILKGMNEEDGVEVETVILNNVNVQQQQIPINSGRAQSEVMEVDVVNNVEENVVNEPDYCKSYFQIKN